MKILYITNMFPRVSKTSGGVFFLKRLEVLKRFGVDFTAVTTGFVYSKTLRFLNKVLKRFSWEALEVRNDITLHHVAVRTLKDYIMEKMGFGSAFMPRKDEFTRACENFTNEISKRFDVDDFDLIHAHGMYDIPAGFIARILSERSRKPFLVTLHGSDVNILMKRESRRRLYVDTLEKADAVIFVSEVLRKTAVELGYSGSNAVVIPNGYDPEIFRPVDKKLIRRKLGIERDGMKYIGFVGNLVHVKGADRLPDIFKSIAQHLDSTFIIVGDGPLRRDIEKRLEGLNVIFTGVLPQAEVAIWMNAMDVMVIPSRSEGFGTVVIEAQACGTCVVGSDAGGLPEAIGFEEFVVEDGDLFERRIADRVVEILKSGCDTEKLLKRSKSFTWENIVKREIEVYEEILKIEE